VGGGAALYQGLARVCGIGDVDQSSADTWILPVPALNYLLPLSKN
jgi:hypothetical protein